MKAFFGVLLFLLAYTLAPSLVAADESKGYLADRDDNVTSIPVWWLPKYPKPGVQYPHNPLWKIEYYGEHIDGNWVQEKLGDVCKAGLSKVLLVDLDETLRSINSKRDRQTNKRVKKYEQFDHMLPPNLQLIKAIKAALNQKAYVAIVTYTQDYPWAIRQFLVTHFPEEHAMIPIIYYDYAQEDHLAKTTPISDELSKVYELQRKNVHATVALQLFSKLFAPEKAISVAMIDDDRQILSIFEENAQANIKANDPTLPFVDKVVGIHPGQFELSKENEESLDWKGAAEACNQIDTFLALE